MSLDARAAALIGQWSPSLRYPDPLIEQLDPRFKNYHMPLTCVERLYHGTRWGEGPVWFGDQHCLIWSDVPASVMYRWDEATGRVTPFRKPSNHGNGNTRDRQGRLITCEHQTRRVTRTEYDGTITVIADSFDGKRLNSPNDVVVKSDGSIWFTDPDYGILSDYEGDRSASEIGACHVYRIDGRSGEIAIVADDFVKPNGLAFSPDESILYIADTGNHKIKEFDPDTGWVLTKVGSGSRGYRNGVSGDAKLNEPNGLVHFGGLWYIADAGNHIARVYDPVRHVVSTLMLWR